MKSDVTTIVVMPVGPGTNIAFAADTIESFLFYTKSSYKIIIADDSHEGTGAALHTIYPQVEVLVTKKPMGGWAGLYINLAKTYKHALEKYSFKILLKLDTDALVISDKPEEPMINFFTNNSTMGMAGQYPLGYNGHAWDVGWPRDRVLNGATTWKYIKRPIANWHLRRLYYKAADNGYIAGESVFGGAYVFSYACLQTLAEKRLLPHYQLGNLNMGEDHIFSLLVKSTGYGLGDLCSGNLPFALAWKGLPAAPETLYQQGKKIIHSTRFWKNEKEEDIRGYFKAKRKHVPHYHQQPAL